MRAARRSSFAARFLVLLGAERARDMLERRGLRLERVVEKREALFDEFARDRGRVSSWNIDEGVRFSLLDTDGHPRFAGEVHHRRVFRETVHVHPRDEAIASVIDGAIASSGCGERTCSEVPLLEDTVW